MLQWKDKGETKQNVKKRTETTRPYLLAFIEKRLRVRTLHVGIPRNTQPHAVVARFIRQTHDHAAPHSTDSLFLADYPGPVTLQVETQFVMRENSSAAYPAAAHMSKKTAPHLALHLLLSYSSVLQHS